jgi:ATP-dependent DNA helicase RecG
VPTPDGKTLLVVRVPKGELRPYRTRRGDYFVRTTSGKRRASRQELLRLFQSAESLHYEETILLQATLKDIDLWAFGAFQRQVLGNIEADDQQLLIRWRLVREYEGQYHPTVAAILLFGRDPQQFLPHAYITAARIPGTDLAEEPSDRERIEGTLFHMLKDCTRFLNIHLKTRHRIRGFEPEQYPELPEVSLREFLVNALVHRDYTVSAPIRLFILDDRVEVRSPGGLPNTVTVDMLKAGMAHVLRNPLIYSAFLRAGMVTDTGSGVRRAIQRVKEAVGREPEIVEQGNELVVIIPRDVSED